MRLGAHITRIVIIRVESPTFEGTSFGTTGRYEKLVGRAFGQVDPGDPRNALIVDIGLAPRNARGLVEYSTDVYILRPVERSKGNGRLFFEINNRGNNFSFGLLNNTAAVLNDPTSAADAGNGFSMRQGYTIVLSGWDAGVAPGAPRQTIAAPIARNPDGSPIVGPALEEFVIDNSSTTTGPLTYPGGKPGQVQGEPLSARALCGRADCRALREMEVRQRSDDQAAAPRGRHSSRLYSLYIPRRIQPSRVWALPRRAMSRRFSIGRRQTMPATPTHLPAMCSSFTRSVFRSPAASYMIFFSWASTKTSRVSACSMEA